MKERKFKVGDKVKIVKFVHSNKIGKVGIITKTYFSDFPKTKFPYRIEVDGNWDCSMMESELTAYLKKNEQLQFAFMSE